MMVHVVCYFGSWGLVEKGLCRGLCFSEGCGCFG